MQTIILISCASKKLSKKAKAEDSYISTSFKLALNYAKTLNPDLIFILSAKYGLLKLSDEIEPYNVSLNQMPVDAIRKWSQTVIQQLALVADLNTDQIIFLAGSNYRKFLIPYIKNYKIPLKGFRIGEQLQFLKRESAVHDICATLHKFFNELPKQAFPFNEGGIPDNGIYILFEKSEKAHTTNRIVRVGTHTGNDQLRSRLKQHFLNENKDRSVFRKNIGRCLLNKRKDPFLNIWNVDLTTKQAKEKYKHLIDHDKQQEIEKEVSDYIQNNLSFVTFEVEDKNKRLTYEAKLISTISLCNICKPSKNWLGNLSPKKKICESGLWQVNELYKTPLSDKDLDQITKFIRRKL